MAMPDYQTFMLPVLKLLADGSTHRRTEIIFQAADALKIPEDDRTTMLPSGTSTVLRSRVGWALTYLKQAALVKTTARGVYQITERGREMLKRGLSSLSSEMLEEFDEFKDFTNRTRSSAESDSIQAKPPIVLAGLSPEETLENAYVSLRTDLVSQLIDALKSVAPARFEQIVIDVLQAMGYGKGREGAARAIGRSGDGGIDGVIEEDRLGLDAVYVQAKRWEGTVGRPVVQAFAGALQGQRANKGVMITTSDFSADARTFVNNNLPSRIVLINGQRLAEMMIDHNVGVSAEVTYTIKRLDSDYFDDQ